MKNWMPTLAALISAAGSFVLFAQNSGMYTFPKLAVALALFMNVGGLAALGITAKQFNVTGGTVGTPSTPEALAVANQAPSVINPPVPTQPIVPPVVVVKPETPAAAPTALDSSKEGK